MHLPSMLGRVDLLELAKSGTCRESFDAGSHYHESTLSAKKAAAVVWRSKSWEEMCRSEGSMW